MKPTLIITHLSDRADGLVRDCLTAAGCPVLRHNAQDREPLPALDDISGLVTLGGRQSATRVLGDPFLTAEVMLLAHALEREVPVLGMCLGAQLLAVAAGGRVTAMGRMNAGWPDLQTLAAAAADPVFGTFPPRLAVLKWHEDVIALPDDAVALATSPGPGADLFRIGRSAWGSQAHLELTPAMLDAWLTDPADVAEVEAAGHDIDGFRSDSRGHLEAQMAAARPIFYAFAELTSAWTSRAA